MTRYHAYTTTPLPYTKSGIFTRIRKWSLFGRITAEVCLLALRQPAKAHNYNPCPEPLCVGIRFITIKIDALGSYHEDTQDRLNSNLQFGTLAMFPSFDALATSGTARKLQVSLYSTSEAFCAEIRTSVLVMYAFNWPPTSFRSESYIGSATALPDTTSITLLPYLPEYKSHLWI